jgi:hypothetical protein
VTTPHDFLVRHLPGEHPYLKIVHDALKSGACVAESPGSPVSCDELLTIYRHRAAHLARFNALHARELRDNVLRFCELLAASPSATAIWWLFRMPNGVHYNFVEHSTTHRLLGALRTVSKLEVLAEEWDRLWSD